MKPARPSARLQLDGRSLSAAEAALVHLRLSLGFGPAHDAAQLVIWPGSRLSDAQPGASLSVSLGEAGDEVAVWSGEVVDVESTPEGTRLHGLSATVALSRRHRSQAYLRQSAVSIVRDLASDVRIDEVQADSTLDLFTVDDRRSVWAQLLELAALTGCEISASADGGLRFVPPKSAGTHASLRRGAEVLWWALSGGDAAPAPAVAARGAGSEAGAEKWHWLRRDPVPSPGETPTRLHGAFRTRDPAEALAEALATRAARTRFRGRVVALGQPSLRPGDLVELPDLPAPGAVRVLAVEHVLDGRQGFLSILRVGGTGAASLPGSVP